MKIRIEAIISTAGNDEAYVGHHLGLHLINRPLTSMVTVFIEEVTPEEYVKIDKADREDMKELSLMFRNGPNALQIESFQLKLIKSTADELAMCNIIRTQEALEKSIR